MADPGGLAVAPGVFVPVSELEWRFSTSGGAGGQHVNTSNTRAEVRLDLAASPSLPEWARRRLLDRLGPVVSVVASDRRSQAQNRALALERMARRLTDALHVEPPRRATRPTRSSQRRRLEAKRRQGERKRQRGSGGDRGSEGWDA
ncbi:MAG: alternative ribosome rescue aminoacyl-tRNA hydrolase ArfB [Acidimicrobiales bacterium]